jgi:predicted O-methyltransferase YrrM
MDDRFQAVLDRYNARAADEAQEREAADRTTIRSWRDKYLLHVGEEVGRFLHALAIARGAKRIVELGTSYGYSTLFLADAARATGGKLLTFDVSAEKQDYARTQLVEAGLDGFVEFYAGDALELLDGVDGGFDLVLIDIWKDMYVRCFELTRPKLAENGIIAADNILRPVDARPQAEAYRDAVRADPTMQTILLPIGSGIELSCLWTRQPG